MQQSAAGFVLECALEDGDFYDEMVESHVIDVAERAPPGELDRRVVS